MKTSEHRQFGFDLKDMMKINNGHYQKDPHCATGSQLSQKLRLIAGILDSLFGE